MANLDPRAFKDQWESADPQECQDFQAPRDTGDCLELTVLRDLKGNKVSPETWESPVRSVLLVQWVPVAQVESVVALDPQAPRVFVVATDFQAQEAPPDLSDPRDPQESPASPDPREIKDSRDLRAAAEFKVHAERTGCPDRQESPVFKEPQVSMAPTERRDPEETWESREPQDSQDPEDLPVPPEIPEWADPRVSRVNLVCRVFAV